VPGGTPGLLLMTGPLFLLQAEMNNPRVKSTVSDLFIILMSCQINLMLLKVEKSRPLKIIYNNTMFIDYAANGLNVTAANSTFKTATHKKYF
jgi:hypothetical protein